MGKPKIANSVSVVITTYKRDEFLAEALTSLAVQTLPLHDIVVVDDGGSGTAKAVVERFGPRFRYFWQPNGGMQSARNLGVKEATGEWIAFLDDDDLWEENRNELINELISTNQVDLIAGDFRKFDSAGVKGESVFSEIGRHSRGFWDGIHRPDDQNYSIIGSFPTTRLFPVYPFWPSTLAIRRDLFARLGGWDVSLQGAKAEDIDFIFRAIKAGQLGLIWVPTVRYRSHEGNDSADGLAVALGRVRLWEHLLKRPDLDDDERKTIHAAKLQGLSEAHWSAFARQQYQTVTDIAARLGWRRLSFKERGKTLLARLFSMGLMR